MVYGDTRLNGLSRRGYLRAWRWEETGLFVTKTLVTLPEEATAPEYAADIATKIKNDEKLPAQAQLILTKEDIFTTV